MTLTAKPKQPATHKKRSGQHHKHSHNYVKSYWPYLPMAAIAVTGIILAQTLQPRAMVLGAHDDLTVQSLITATNQQRDKKHESDLSYSSALSKAASAKARDMVTRNYWSHNTPDGKQPWTFIAAQGYDYAKAGENLAAGFGSSDAVIKGWMASTEHRENMLDTSYTAVGFGVATSENFVGKGSQTVVVAYYAEPASLEANTRPSTSNFTTVSQPVSRVQVITGATTGWSELASLFLLLGATGVFLTKHVRLWHRALARGEHFVLTHPFLDASIVTMITVTYLLTRMVGSIL